MIVEALKMSELAKEDIIINYHKESTPMTFSEAKNKCQGLGKKLVTIHSFEEATFVSGKYNQSVLLA